MPLSLKELPGMWSAWQQRHAERDDRFNRIAEAVGGFWGQYDPDEDPLDNSTPNLIQVALEDTAEAAALPPTLRVTPSDTLERTKKQARQMEKIAQGYTETSKFDLLIPQSLMSLIAYGMAVWVAVPDMVQKIPLIESRDARNCYPEPGYRAGDHIRKCMFARDIYISQLPSDYQNLVVTEMAANGHAYDSQKETKVTILEYFDEAEYVISAIYTSAGTTITETVEYTPVELERIENKTGVCPVVIGTRITLDNEVRGQFDQVIDILKAHSRLQQIMLEYMDQAVYSDIWVKDLIGDMPYGGGAYVELGPQGSIGRVPPAVPSLAATNELGMLKDYVHLGGRWPKSRPGEIDQAIASAKFVEATAGMMNTAIKTYHLLLKHMYEQILPICFRIDKLHFEGTKTTAGVLRNQEFLEDYDTKDINLSNRIRAEYGLGLGRDPAQSAVLHIQYSQSEFISKEFVMENIDGLLDVSREQSRIEHEQLASMMKAQIMLQAEQGALSPRALVEITRKRLDGELLVDLYEEFIVKPAEEAAASQMTSGLTGGPVQPGALPGPGGPAGPGGPPVPQAPSPPDMMNRLGVNVPGTGTLGAQVTS